VAEEVQARMDKPKLVGDLVAHWKRYADGRKSIVRATGVAHSQHVRDQFASAGVPAEHVDGGTTTAERDAILARFAAGKTLVLTNCNVVNVGFDEPSAACFVDADPTKSYVKFRQGAGRVQRPSPGKADAVYLDHAGNIARHGLPDADVDWQLSETERAYKPVDGEPGKAVMACPRCAAQFRPQPACPSCGHAFAKSVAGGREMDHEDGVLVEVADAQGRAVEAEKFGRLWHRALAVAAARDLSAGVAANMFQRDTGKLPWEVGGLPNLPGTKDEWRRPVRDLYPQYVRRRTA
jgi:DNA repair protein RadD